MISEQTLFWLDVGNTVLETAGHLASGKATEIQARRSQVSKEFDAYQLEQQAHADFAYSQHLAIEETRNAEYVASRAIAMAGASGAGVSDGSVENLVGRIKSEGAYRAALHLYSGEEAARVNRMRAKVSRLEGSDAIAEGKNRKTAYQLEAIGALGEGASTLYERYGIRPATEG